MSPAPERALQATGAIWAVATPHTLASEAAAEAFRDGGNAIDAALAAAVTLAVVYPHMCGVGGDLFALVERPDGPTIAVNASGAAPAAVDVEAVRAAAGGPGSTAMPEYGPFSITVPGAVSGWAALHREGARLPWASAFERAIAHAREGVAVAPSLAATLVEEPARLAADLGMAEIFFPGGPGLTAADTLVQPALAETLRAVHDDGPGTLYGGAVGERYARGLAASGCPIAAADLSAHDAELDSPLTAPYRDLHVSVCPPNSQGFVLLEILLGIERLGLDPDPLGPDAGTLAELFRAASADRDRHNADPRRARVPIGTLLDEGHIAGICDAVRNHLAEGPTAPARGDTIALVAADTEGFAVSLIQSLSSGFGSGILEPTTGIVAHNRGALFSLDASSPNMLAGGKRPAHTLMPVLVHRDGRLAAVAGTMGGGAQPQINAQNLVRAFDLGLTPAEALDGPRWLVGGMEPDATLRHIEAEARVPISTAERLAAADYEVRRMAAYDEGAGHSHLIQVGPSGELTVATDPRADGSALAG